MSDMGDNMEDSMGNSVGNSMGKEQTIVFAGDKHRMNWLRGDYEYAYVRTSGALRDMLFCHVQSTMDGDVLHTDISITNTSTKPCLVGSHDISVQLPLIDKYDDSATCLTQRCNTHIFCGGGTGWVCALRMGGEPPHLGLVVTEGRLAGYSIERDTSYSSNDRGCFLLHPQSFALSVGGTHHIRWTIFPHNGKKDFVEKAGRMAQMVWAVANRYVLFPNEGCAITVRPSFTAKQVMVNGQIAMCNGGKWTAQVCGLDYGEHCIPIEADGIKTSVTVFCHKGVQEIADARCRFIAERQQYNGGIPQLRGAYLAYDNEDECMVYTAENDRNGARERVGMGGC